METLNFPRLYRPQHHPTHNHSAQLRQLSHFPPSEVSYIQTRDCWKLKPLQYIPVPPFHHNTPCPATPHSIIDSSTRHSEPINLQRSPLTTLILPALFILLRPLPHLLRITHQHHRLRPPNPRRVHARFRHSRWNDFNIQIRLRRARCQSAGFLRIRYWPLYHGRRVACMKEACASLLACAEID